MTEPVFTRITPDISLSHKIEEQIRDAIIERVYLPGDRLPGEIELSNVFGVSRTAVREALRMLSGRGLISIRKGSGAYVTEIASEQVVEPLFTLLEIKCKGESLNHIIQLRLMIEPEIAALAAVSRTEENIHFWKDSLESMRDHQDDYLQMIPFDIQFHRQIALATQNPIIPIVMDPIYKLLGKFIASTYEYPPAHRLAIEKHENLLECFILKDSKRAYDIMREHMRDGNEHVDMYYKRHSDS